MSRKSDFNYGVLRKTIYDKIASEERDKKKKETYVERDKYDEEIRHAGKDWYYSGRGYEEGLKHFNNNTNFIDGWNEAVREVQINELIAEDYNTGALYFIMGIDRESIPNKQHILRGYDDAANGIIDKTKQSRNRR